MVETGFQKFNLLSILMPKTVTESTDDWVISGTQLWGGGERGLPCPFLKIEKSAMILGKRALIASILGLNLSFKM